MRIVAVGLLLGTQVAAAQQSDTMVVRVGPPAHPGEATLVPELTLVDGSTADEYTFTNAFVYSGAGGSIYIVDLVDPQNVGNFRTAVRKYDRAGKLIRSYGRTGQGPGEYTGAVSDVQELPDGRVLLSHSRGILVYSAAGDYLTQMKVAARGGFVGAAILYDPAGYVSIRGSRFVDSVPPNEGQRASIATLHRFRFDGSVVDTVVPDESSLHIEPPFGATGRPFEPTYLWAWSPLGYLVTAYSAAYAIDLRIPRRSGAGARSLPFRWQQGDPVLSIRHTTAPVAVLDAERDDWRRNVTMFNRVGDKNRNWEWTGPDVPRVKPPIRRLVVDDDGRIWVRLSQPARLDPSVAIPARLDYRVGYRFDVPYRWPEPVVFDVFEPSGTYVGRVRFPDNLVQLIPNSRWIARGDTVWAVTQGKDDVPTIKRYRIRWLR